MLKKSVGILNNEFFQSLRINDILARILNIEVLNSIFQILFVHNDVYSNFDSCLGSCLQSH